MKALSFALAAIIFLSTAWSQAKLSASLEAKNAGSGKLLLRMWETDYGSFDRDHLRVTFLDVRVGTVGRTPFDADLEIVFHGKHPATKEAMVASWQVGKVHIEPGHPRRYIVSSGMVKSNTTRYAALGEFYGSGTSISAWAMRLKVGDQVVASANSGAVLNFGAVPAMAAASVAKDILEKAEPTEITLKEIGLNERL